jgi:hypothetical protein
VRRFPINIIAAWRPVSVNAGAAGSKASWAVTLTTAPISVRRNGPGLTTMAITGASTGPGILITPIITVVSSGDATAADV